MHVASRGERYHPYSCSYFCHNLSARWGICFCCMLSTQGGEIAVIAKKTTTGLPISAPLVSVIGPRPIPEWRIDAKQRPLSRRECVVRVAVRRCLLSAKCTHCGLKDRVIARSNELLEPYSQHTDLLTFRF